MGERRVEERATEKLAKKLGKRERGGGGGREREVGGN